MGAKLFIGTPGCETKVSSKKNWFGLCEIAWFLWQPIANLRIIKYDDAFVLKYVYLCCFCMILLRFCRFSLIFINMQIR